MALRCPGSLIREGKWGQEGGLSLSGAGATFRLGEGAAEIQETFIILGRSGRLEEAFMVATIP